MKGHWHHWDELQLLVLFYVMAERGFWNDDGDFVPLVSAPKNHVNRCVRFYDCAVSIVRAELDFCSLFNF